MRATIDLLNFQGSRLLESEGELGVFIPLCPNAHLVNLSHKQLAVAELSVCEHERVNTEDKCIYTGRLRTPLCYKDVYTDYPRPKSPCLRLYASSQDK